MPKVCTAIRQQWSARFGVGPVSKGDSTLCRRSEPERALTIRHNADTIVQRQRRTANRTSYCRRSTPDDGGSHQRLSVVQYPSAIRRLNFIAGRLCNAPVFWHRNRFRCRANCEVARREVAEKKEFCLRRGTALVLQYRRSKNSSCRANNRICPSTAPVRLAPRCCDRSSRIGHAPPKDFYVAIGRNPAQVSTGLTNSGKAGRRSSLSWKDRDCDWGRILPQEPPRDLGRIEGSNHSSYELRRNGRHMKRPQLGLWRSSTSGTPGITPEVWLAAHPERGRFFGGFQPIC